MSQTLQPMSRAATAADFSPEWIAQVRAAIQRDGQATRPAALHQKTANGTTGYLYSPHPVIEVQSINSGEWHPLNLPTNGVHFTDEAARDEVLDQLVGKAR